MMQPCWFYQQGSPKFREPSLGCCEPLLACTRTTTSFAIAGSMVSHSNSQLDVTYTVLYLYLPAGYGRMGVDDKIINCSSPFYKQSLASLVQYFTIFSGCCLVCGDTWLKANGSGARSHCSGEGPAYWALLGSVRLWYGSAWVVDAAIALCSGD